MSAPAPPASNSPQQSLKELFGRVPLHTKLIAAVLGLVIIALAVISVVGLVEFRNYLQDRADEQLKTLMSEALQANNPTVGGPQGPTFTFSGYVIELRDTQGNLVQGCTWCTWQNLTVPGPNVSITRAWLAANAGKTVTVPAAAGQDTWRVLVRRVGFHEQTPFGQGPNQTGILIVGADLGHLDQAVGWLAKVDLVVSARRSEERMRQFVADASHELRTPLTAIRGYAEYYRQRGGVENGDSTGEPESSRQPARSGAVTEPVPGAGPAEAAEAAGDGAAPADLAGYGHLTRPDMDRIMERVEQESSRMGGLVEDMLVLARLDEQRPVERRPVDLLTLAADAVQDARVVAPGRKIDLTVGTGAAFLVLGDEARLRQVISNLMNNALTHTPAGTPITVRILAGFQGGDPAVPAAILEVADRGPGLTREQAERVFERFYRADQARDRRTGGTGLGLAIVQALVAAHGGTVGVNTAPGEGATFWITLPLAPEAAAD